MLTQYHRAPTLLVFTLLIFDAVKNLLFTPLPPTVRVVNSLKTHVLTTQLTAGVSQEVRAVAETQEKASSHCGVCSR